MNIVEVEGDLEATEADIAAAQADAEKMSFEEARALVQDSVKLQYILACFRAGVVDCPSGTLFTTAEKLARVQQ